MQLPNVPGIQVFLSVGGAPLSEHNGLGLVNSDTKGSRYIEALSGANFVVNVSTDEAYPHPLEDVECRISLDGTHVTTQLLGPANRPKTLKIEGRVIWLQGECMLERFMFAKLHLNSIVNGEFGRLGMIDVELVRARRYTDIRRPAHLNTTKPLHLTHRFRSVAEGGISRRSLNGRTIDRYATTGNPEPTGRFHVVSLIGYPNGETPFASYTFTYLSRNALQQKNIIKRSPAYLDLDDVSDDQYQILRIYEGLSSKVGHVGIVTIRSTQCAMDKPFAMPVTELRQRCPQTLIAFYEAHWSSTNGGGEGTVDLSSSEDPLRGEHKEENIPTGSNVDLL